MKDGGIYVSELSTTRHTFSGYHFCRGNNSKRKTRIGVILKGKGSYIYLNRRLEVNEGDVVFIPEHVWCYSEWRGTPEIEVVYVNCFLHYEGLRYLPQRIESDGALRERLLRVHELLSEGPLEELEAYAEFYRVLREILPRMEESDLPQDVTLRTAMEYITSNWNRPFSAADVARQCCVSESTLYHTFQRTLGQTPVQFLHSIRINMAIEYLENTGHSISTISREVGFLSENHFRRVFTELTGTTPLRFRKGM